nr:zinc finger, CCHC-type, retrotransposon Gag domain protein [Tanacetum cinerariifolium]
MDESIPVDKQCRSSLELFKVKAHASTIFKGVEMCKESIAKRTYLGYIDPFIHNTIEQKFSPELERILTGLHQFQRCLKDEMVADLRYFNSLKLEVDSLRSQLETQKTQFSNEIDRLSREYYYADHMNAILGVNTELDEDKGIAISELKKLIEKLKGNSVDSKIGKSSVVCQQNAFKSQRHSVLRKPPHIKSNQMEDRVMLNNSQGKKQKVEDHRRDVKFSMNKMSVTMCNDSLNAKTLNVNFVCVTYGIYVLNGNHDKCVCNDVNSRTSMPMVVPLVEIILFIIDSGCSKHMTGNLKLLINFVEKFLGTMVNTRTDADLSAAVQNALQTLLPQIREEIREEFRTGSGSSNAGGNPPPRFLRLAGFLGAAAGTEEEQAKHFQWGLRRSTQNHLMCMSYTDAAQVANAARNYEILHERDDDDTKRPEKR